MPIATGVANSMASSDTFSETKMIVQRSASPVNNSANALRVVVSQSISATLGVGKKHLLAVDPKRRDRPLALGGRDPVGKLGGAPIVDIRVLGRIDRDHAVRVEHPGVAGDFDLQ